MLCYKDRAFCTFWEDCNEGWECERAATNDVWNGAEAEGLPLDVYADKPRCFNQKEVTDE